MQMLFPSGCSGKCRYTARMVVLGNTDDLLLVAVVRNADTLSQVAVLRSVWALPLVVVLEMHMLCL